MSAALLDSSGSCHPVKTAAFDPDCSASSCGQLSKPAERRVTCPLRSAGVTLLPHYLQDRPSASCGSSAATPCTFPASLLPAGGFKAEKVEPLRFAFSPPLPVFDRVRTEIPKSRLPGMDAVPRLNFRTRSVSSARNWSASDFTWKPSTISSATHHADLALRPLPTPRLGPRV